MTDPENERSGAIQSVERAAHVLRAVAERQHAAVGELAALLGVHKSTASRLVSTLVGAGLLEPTPGGAVRLGHEARRLGRLASGRAGLAEVAQEPLDRLAALTGETATVSVRDGDEAVTIAQSSGAHRVAPQWWVGSRTPLRLTADGKVLLAFSEEAPARPAPWRAEQARIRHVEWATALGDLEEGLHGVAVPLLQDGRCVAAVCVSGPAYRLDVERLETLARQCRRTAFEISDRRTAQEEIAS